jgi:hypothetical protein
MSLPTLASINLEWDEVGSVSHKLHSNIPANDYQEFDALALSVVLLTGSQLGILPPAYGLQVIDRILKYLDGLPLNPEPIQYPLSSARIDLHEKGKTMVCAFHPNFLGGGTMQPEESVSRLLGNLPVHLDKVLQGELNRFFKTGLLIVSIYYLSEALPKGQSRGLFSSGRFNQQKVQMAMLAFNETVYPHWSGGLNLPQPIFTQELVKAKSIYKKHVSKF